jgi:hypothetical protein
MKRHEERATGFRAQAALAVERGAAAVLPSVRETQARAAAAWEALAEAEDVQLRAADKRKAALEAAQLADA